LNETVKVERLAEGIAWVRAAQNKACDSCGVRGACGARLLENKQAGLIPVTLPDTLWSQVEIGSDIKIEVPDALLLTTTFSVYLLPILAMLVGATLPSLFFQITETGQIVASFFSLTAGLWWSLFRVRGRKQLDSLRPSFTNDRH
jgi:positive regulator of sigma E activity